MITLSSKGDFSRTSEYLDRMKGCMKLSIFDKYGRAGVKALSDATPVETGLTAKSWYYRVKRDNEKGVILLTFHNSNVVDGYPVAIIVHYGHATRNGGFVQGRDYINKAIQPLFDQLANDIWKEASKK